MINSSPNHSGKALSFLFSKKEWLASCSDSVVEIQNENKESILFHSSQKWFQKALLPSVLTPYQSAVNESETVIKEISKYDFVELYLNKFSEKDIQLFKQNKFELHKKHTRIIEKNDAQKVYQNFKPSLKRQIKKASETITIYETHCVSELWEINKQVFQRQHQSVPFSDEQLEAIATTCQQLNCGKIYIAKNNKQKNCAALFIVWDETSAYYLAGGIATEHKNSGAMSLLLWNAIEWSMKNKKDFDFCGSTISGIDNFFSTFGAIKKEILIVNRYNNNIQKWAIGKWKK